MEILVLGADVPHLVPQVVFLLQLKCFDRRAEEAGPRRVGGFTAGLSDLLVKLLCHAVTLIRWIKNNAD